jgi:hypothetical protein
MAYASKAGRARTSSTSPQAFGICDRCGFTYNHVDLAWQFDYAGAGLINKRILVCTPCMDTPQEQLRAIVLPQDPVPILNPRVEAWAEAESDYITTSQPTVFDPITGIPVPSSTNIVSESGQNYATQPIGVPTGLEQGAVMPLFQKTAYNVNLFPLSVTSNGTQIITVTCSKAHGMVTNSQISVEGLANNNANGFYSVTVTTATAFTYQTNNAIPSAALLQGTTNMVTALVGLPYDYDQIPQVGP